MGNCSSAQFTRKGGGGGWTIGGESTVKVIHSGNGRLQEFRQPVKASSVLSEHPGTFLCSVENMFVDCHMPHVPGDEELQTGQLYFLMPVSESNHPLSLHELCSWAIKASSALQGSSERRKKLSTLSFRSKSNGNGNVKVNTLSFRSRSSGDNRLSQQEKFQLAIKQLEWSKNR